MNSDLTTEMFFGGNVCWSNTTKKYLTRDVPTTSTNFAVELGSFNLTNGAALFEFLIQVNTSGFTVSKFYKFSIINNATSGAWHLLSPEVNSGASSTNDFALEINVNNSLASFRIHRTGGSTAGEAKIFINKYGSVEDAFTSANTSSNVGAPVSTPYSSALSVNSVQLNASNTFSALQTIDSQLVIKGDSNFPALRVGKGNSNLSLNKGPDGSVLVQGTGGISSQFEVVTPNSGQRLVVDANNGSGVMLYAVGGNLKYNTAAGSLFFGGSSTASGILFGSSLTASADVGIARLNAGGVRVTNGGAGNGALYAGRLRIGTTETKTQSVFITGDLVFLENGSGTPAYVSHFTGGYAVAMAAGQAGTVISYDQSGPFSIVGQSSALTRTTPGSGSLNSRLHINTNGDIGIATTNPLAKLDVNGTVRATSFSGNGALLTNLAAANIAGSIPAASLPNPGVSTLGGVRRNIGALGASVTGISTNGALLFSNVGPKIANFKPFDWEPDYASPTLPTTGLINNRPVLSFGDTGSGIAMWTDLTPDNFIPASGIDVAVWWSTNVSVGTVGWEVAIERIGYGANIANSNFGASLIIAASAVPNSGELKTTSVKIPFSDLGGMLPGDMFRLKVSRDVTNDNAVSPAFLHLVELKQKF